MKAGLVMGGPDVAYGPLALLSGTFEEKAAKAAQLGYDGIELMVRDPSGLDWAHVKSTLEGAGLEVPQVVTGELFGADGLCLVTADDDLRRRAEERTRAVVDLAAYLSHGLQSQSHGMQSQSHGMQSQSHGMQSQGAMVN